MPERAVPPSVTTAALLKAQLDRGKDYFELLAPFVRRAALTSPSEVLDPSGLRLRIDSEFGLDLPIRTIATLLDRLARREGEGIRKESNAYLRTALPDATQDAKPQLDAFRELGETFAGYCARKPPVSDGNEGLALLTEFLETHSATLILDDPIPTAKTGRREDIIVASFLAAHLGTQDETGKAITALLQGLVLARAVTLTDLADIQRRFSGLVVYFDTPFVLSAAGLYGHTDEEAARDTIRLLKQVGAVPAVFDVTIAEARRVLGVYEDRLDTALGRQGLWHTPLTAHLLSINATGADVRTASALLEGTLSRKGLVIHGTPPRQRQFVGDEVGLGEALKDVRGPGYEAREDHDINCVAAILTLRRGTRVTRLEDARAVFAASGMVVRSVKKWWRESGETGLPPVLAQSAIVNYCWVKQPSAALGFHRIEMAALCAEILQPSPEAWRQFRDELRRMASDGFISTEEASVILIDSFASKLLVETEEAEALSPGSVADIVHRVREEHRREADAARAETVREREARVADRQEAERELARRTGEQDAQFEARLAEVAGQLNYERGRADNLESSIAGIARILAWIVTVPILGGLVAVFVAVAVFPAIDGSALPPLLKRALEALTIVTSFAGGVFGVSALSLGKPIQRWVETSIRTRLVASPPPALAAGAEPLPSKSTKAEGVAL